MIQGSPLALNPHFKACAELEDSAGIGGRHVYTHCNQLYGDLLDFSLCLMGSRYITSRFLIFPCFHIGSEIWFNLSIMKRTGEAADLCLCGREVFHLIAGL